MSSLRIRLAVPLMWLLRLSLLAFILSLAYILYGAFFGPLKTFGESLPLADQHRIMQNVRLFAEAMQVSGSVAATILALFYFQEATLVGGLLAGGLFFYLGLPYLMVPDELPPIVGGSWAGIASKPVIVLLMASRQLGAVTLLVGVMAAVAGAIQGTQDSFRHPRRAAVLSSLAPRLKGGRWWAKCYQTPYRRVSLCAICPRLEERRACWRVKSGCYCDERIILGQTRAGLSRGEMIQPSLLQIELTPGGHGKQLISCGVCPIYLYHQQQKYNIAAPLVAAGALAAFWYYAGPISHGYYRLVAMLDQIAFRLSFTPESAHARSVLHTALDHPVMQWLLVGSAGLLVLCYSIQALEVVIFKWKL